MVNTVLEVEAKQPLVTIFDARIDFKHTILRHNLEKQMLAYNFDLKNGVDDLPSLYSFSA